MTPEIRKKYKYWRKRTLFTIILGYAAFYFLRTSFSVTMLSVEEHFGVSKVDLGALVSIQAVIFGLGKTFWGLLSDRISARYFLSVGLLLSSIMNILLSCGNNFKLLAFFWIMAGCFLSIGSGPCVKMLAYWFSPEERATKWAVWNASQQIGAAVSVVFSSYILISSGWSGVFYSTGLIGVIVSIIILIRLRDTPQTLGLPEVEEYKGNHNHHHEDDSASTLEIIKNKLIKNKKVWRLCFANAFFYIFRMGILQWAPTFLREFKGSSIEGAAYRTAMFDASSILGGIILSYVSDRIFKGRRSPVVFFSIIALCVFLYILLEIPSDRHDLHSLFMILIGFFVTCPQILIGVAAADFSSNRVAATANGLVGLFGYMGAAISGAGVGYIAEHYGWECVFMGFIASAAICASFFIFSWNDRSGTIGSE